MRIINLVFSSVSGDIADGVGGYDGKGDYTYIWTATEVSGSSAAFLPCIDDAHLGSNNDKTFGLAVRCVK